MSVALSNRRSLGNASLLVENAGESSKKPEKSKRYSTAFGLVSNSPKSKDEQKKQQDVAEIYQGVVKRVQENKLTAKNAFLSRLFIDDLDVVLIQAKGSFHKASCAVATAAEVYCLLVDDLSQSTTMVQELLFNNQASSGAQSTKRGDNDGEDARQNLKKGNNGNSQDSSCSTLETNLNNIQSDVVEAELEIDAQFQKLLQGKDSGTEGMLLNMLKVYNGPNLALDSARIPAFAKREEDPRPKMGGEIPKEWLKTPSFSVSFDLGQAFAELRSEANKTTEQTSAQQQSSVVETMDDLRSLDSKMPATPLPPPLPSAAAESNNDAIVEDYEYDDGGDHDDNDDGGFDNPDFVEDRAMDDEGGEENEFPIPNCAMPLIMRAFDAQMNTLQEGSKLDHFVIPENVLVEIEHQEQERGAGTTNKKQQIQHKTWLGFSHWKAPRIPGGGATATADSTPAAVKRKKKEEVKKIDFFQVKPLNEKVVFAKPSHPRLIQLPKTSKFASQQHLLPVNTHFLVSDLCHFFSRPHQVLRPLSVSSKTTTTPTTTMERIQDDDNGYFDNGDYDDDGGDDRNDDNDDFNDDHIVLDSHVKLVAPAHHVERIRVAYATRAKKVDVKQLKLDLWDTIDSLNPAALLEEEASNEEVVSQTSRVSLAGSIRTQQEIHPSLVEKPADVITVPFYFICMLHLANEKGLELKSSEGLDDISIFRSPPVAH